jgi:succinate-semialdehyde dehydrogenase/glutarate-semialdehyde dehydrogenase
VGMWPNGPGFSARRVSTDAQLRVGMTSINDAIATSRVAGLPFGGRGHSGFGRKHGDEGLREFAYPHAISVRTAAGTTGSSFERPAGAVAAALAATVDRLSQQN